MTNTSSIINNNTTSSNITTNTTGSSLSPNTNAICLIDFNDCRYDCIGYDTANKADCELVKKNECPIAALKAATAITTQTADTTSPKTKIITTCFDEDKECLAELN